MTWLIVNEEYLPEGKALLANMEVNIISDGKCHLGAALGSRSFAESYVKCKVSRWIETVKKLSMKSCTQPHAAYAAFTRGLTSQLNYLMRTILGISDLIEPLNNAINNLLIPVLTGYNSISNRKRQLLALCTYSSGWPGPISAI